ncbi:MAG: hypothetical protein JSR80_08150 [Verrucomicrobia bacterium]|nr:hypothetical protein [Verrucomicrobiota bacterium]
MAERSLSEFQWNRTRETAAISVLDTLSSSKMGANFQEIAGKYLVDIGATFRQLRKSYLSVSQRKQLSKLLCERFLQLQKLAAKVKDKEAHIRLSRYLAFLSGYGMIRRQEGREECLTLLEAIITGHLLAWVHGFYNAHHRLTQRDALGKEVHFSLSEPCVNAEREARNELMRWLLEEESA